MLKQKTVTDWVEEFEKEYFTRRARTPKTQTTWQTDYQRVFRQLPQSQVLTPEVLKATAIATPADTRTRKRFCIALGALGRFAGFDFTLKSYAGRYSFKSVKRRELPSDTEIVAGLEQITQESWRWVYGMLAAYGLRPHEVFLLDHQRLKTGNPGLRVLDGKTGARLVFPLYPEWVEQFELRKVVLPQVSGRNNSDLGHRVAQAFRRFQVPFSAYDLRHCWAVRSLEFGLEDSLAAKQMGHTTQIHTELYHAWISEKRQRQMWEAMLAKPDRPLAP